MVLSAHSRLATTVLGAFLISALPAAAQHLTEERGYDRKGDDYTSFRSRGLGDCKAACFKDSRCRAYTYDTRNDACYLKSRINSKQRNDAMITGYRDNNAGDGGGDWGGRGRGLTEEPGYDRKGDDYTSFRSRGLGDCKAACFKDSRCQAYTYDTRNDACYLKSRINSKQRDGGMVTGYREAGAGGGGGYGEVSEELAMDRKGNDYSSFQVRSLDACKDACRRDARCRAYTFDGAYSTCYLKDRVNSPQPSAGKVTGVKGGGPY